MSSPSGIGQTALTFHAGAMQQTPTLLLPARLRVRGLDMLGGGGGEEDVSGVGGPWLRLDLAEFAWRGLAALRQACETGRYVIDLDEYAETILLEHRDGLVAVGSTMREHAAVVPFAELHAVWLAFFDRVRIWATAAVPGVADYPVWSWRNDARISPEEYRHTLWRTWFAENESWFPPGSWPTR